MAEGTTRQESCERLNAAAYLDGELDAAASLYFEDHIRECSSCAATLAELQRAYGARLPIAILPRGPLTIPTLAATARSS